MSFSGCVLRASSQARTAISLAPIRSSTSTSKDQKHQHQYLPYLLGFSGWSKLHTCHVSPSSIVTSTRVTFLPPPARTSRRLLSHSSYKFPVDKKHNKLQLSTFNWLPTILQVATTIPQVPIYTFITIPQVNTSYPRPETSTYLKQKIILISFYILLWNTKIYNVSSSRYTL